MLNLSKIKIAAGLLCMLASLTHAQWEQNVEGIELGKVVLKPSVDALVGYDNRVIQKAGGGAEGDFYSDVAAEAVLQNRPSRYNLKAKGRYGYRAYSEYSNLNDDFYNAIVSLGTKKGPLLWGLSTDYAKTLDYNAFYDPSSGQQPDSVLTQASKRSTTRANMAYDSKRFHKTALVPSYTFLHYYQEYQEGDSAEWQIHNGILKLRHQYTGKTRIYTGVVYSLQTNHDEDGYIATLAVGAEHRMTDKTSWRAELGYALADYEISGTDQGFVSRLSGNWQATPKVSTYLFGGNNFQPGYSGGAARWVYRLGYGAKWQAVKKFGLKAGVLHDYQEEIGSNKSGSSIYGDVRNFLDLQAVYDPIDRLSLVAGIRHNQDERDPAQTIATLKAVYRFY